MIEVKRFHSDHEMMFSLAMEIRTRVFVSEQHVDPDLEVDGFDVTSTHYLLLIDERPVGTARRRDTAHGTKLERFAVLKDQRNKGLGAILLGEVLSDLETVDRLIYLHAQDEAVSFYARHGFVIQGEAFEEAGIIHYKMIFCGKDGSSG